MRIGAAVGWESPEPTESWSSSRGTGSTPVPARNMRERQQLRVAVSLRGRL